MPPPESQDHFNPLTTQPAPSLNFGPPWYTSAKLHGAVLVLASLILFFAGLGRLPLIEPDEGRNAQVAREMLGSGDWVTPHYNSFPYLDKPVVFFALVATSFRILGVSEFAARLPSALAGLGVVLLVWFLARRLFDPMTALRAGLVFATAPLAIGLARFVIFDMTLTLLVTVALVSFWFYESGGFVSRRLAILLFASMGVATITKGPVGFLLPLLTILAFQALRGRFRDLKRLHWGLGAVVFLAATLPWFVAASMRNPVFPGYALWDESLLRFATGSARREKSVFFYVPVYLAGFFPWSLFLLAAGLARVRRWRELREEKHKPVLFLFVWALVVFVFFTVSRSKLPGYFLPAVVPLAILTGLAWREVGPEPALRRPRWLAMGFALTILTGMLLAFVPQVMEMREIEARLAEKLPASFLTLLKPTIFYSGLILAALGLIGRNLSARLRWRSLAQATFAIAAVMTPLLVLRWMNPLRVYAAGFSSRALARQILASPERDTPVFLFFTSRTGLPFYLGRPVGFITWDGNETSSNYIATRLKALGLSKWRGEAARAALGPMAPALLMDEDEFRDYAAAPESPMLVVVRNREVGRLLKRAPDAQPLWTEWNFSVWKIAGKAEMMNDER
jgi:4-amino-4-deoxy-L-arabinose transferase-like glycosyltransferase